MALDAKLGGNLFNREDFSGLEIALGKIVSEKDIN